LIKSSLVDFSFKAQHLLCKTPACRPEYLFLTCLKDGYLVIYLKIPVKQIKTITVKILLGKKISVTIFF